MWNTCPQKMSCKNDPKYNFHAWIDTTKGHRLMFFFIPTKLSPTFNFQLQDDLNKVSWKGRFCFVSILFTIHATAPRGAIFQSHFRLRLYRKKQIQNLRRITWRISFEKNHPKGVRSQMHFPRSQDLVPLIFSKISPMRKTHLGAMLSDSNWTFTINLIIEAPKTNKIAMGSKPSSKQRIKLCEKIHAERQTRTISSHDLKFTYQSTCHWRTIKLQYQQVCHQKQPNK